ncbi:HIT family protein [Georgenia satyanarayanai]|uniref:HIT family protein n=1 Tax=Georgenia satyanarayanai TaxID=860221 RepID=UPI0012653F7C|nr:HIT family protein [Georgenia satyanarayanai]
MPSDDTCVFCRIADGVEPAEVVLTTAEVVAFLDVRPVFKGHVLVVPREHVVTLPELPDALLAPYYSAVRQVVTAVPEAFGAQGTFVAMNNVVSQSVAHLHTHVVPRTKGDGLRGFFWPRARYAAGELEEYGARLRGALDRG